MVRSHIPLEAGSRPLRGILLKIISVFFFVGMTTCLKAAGDVVPPGQLVFFRSFFALVPVLLYLWWVGGLRTSLSTDDLTGHFIRGIVGVTSMALGFFALTQLPYPQWVSLSYAAPLMTVVFAAIFLREVVRAYRWFAVLIGLVGILIVALPSLFFSADEAVSRHSLGIVASLGAAAAAAIAMIQVRVLVAHEKITTIVVYFSLTCSIISLATVPFGWAPLNATQAALLVTAGLCGGVGQLLLTGCYKYADTSTIAPFEYTSIIGAVLIGYYLFGEKVGISTLLGATIIISAGVFIIFREHRLGLERRTAKKVSPPGPS
ncbi:DMT family transporter [Aureimonas fodinaquatilis]|uniref:DMT family transporter n=1 Tax=Aureimonas fodinaquatilis TaxID=2565783 RepID=A0A5B0DW43_9HYPH|nr:DMT family transporter [Aureimonas fodinaquatilis]KAA0971047.1 DMT family transporter [Aureimonas fodinaquatilis]